jgi:hypothetical protein
VGAEPEVPVSTRVAWATLEPALTENVIAIMLCRQNPSAMRIRPSQGDGGIDVITVTAAGWVVDQIKYFSASLTASQKTQVRNSFDRLRAYATEQRMRIAEWHLVVPVDPTNEERIWFDGLTANAGYPCEWHGLSHVEGLAGAYQDVIDYYLHNGRERLETLVGQLSEVIRLGYMLGEGGSRPLAPSEVQTGLLGLYAAINAHDPHYRYSFSVDAEFPEISPEPYLVAGFQKKTDVACVTFKIYAKYAEAPKDRPVPITVRLAFPSASAETEALQAFHDFGAPATVEDPEGNQIEWNAELPGGLGGIFRGGRFTFGPARTDDAEPYRIRLQILDPDGQEISTCGLQMEPVTTGISGVGVRANGVEDHGVFRLELRTNLVNQRVNMTLTTIDLAGKHPDDVLPGLRVVVAMHPPNKWRFAEPHGPMNDPAATIPGAVDVSLGPALMLIEALAVIQRHTAEQITIPDLTSVTQHEAGELVRLAFLLREGSVEVRWTPFDLGLPDAPAPAGNPPQSMSIERPCTVRLGGREIVLGTVRYELMSAQIESVTPVEDGFVRVRFVPGEDPTATLIYEPRQPG